FTSCAMSYILAHDQLRIARAFETPVRLAANRLSLSCFAGVRFLPRLKAGVSEVPDEIPGQDHADRGVACIPSRAGARHRPPNTRPGPGPPPLDHHPDLVRQSKQQVNYALGNPRAFFMPRGR